MTNPLSEPFELPPFSHIQPEHIEPAVESVIAHCKANIDQVVAAGGPYSWDNLELKLDDADDRLNRVWSPISHLNSVKSSPEWRQAHDQCLPALSEYGTWVGQHKGLFSAYQQLADSEAYQTLKPEQRKVIDNALRDFRLSGVDLPADKQQRFAQIQLRLSELSSTFANQLLDATEAWFKQVTDPAQLSGIPESTQQRMADTAKQKELEGYVITLQIPDYLAVMTYADDRALREEVYTAYCTRASEVGPQAGQFDNTPVIEEILALRFELAQLLGFNHYAERSLVTKMAPSWQQVRDFLTDLAERSKPQAEQELSELQAFANDSLGIAELQSWDVAYCSEKLKEQRFDINEEALRPYFPEPKVIDGLFTITGKLFGVHYQRRDDVDVWHPDVRFYDVLNSDDEVIAGFYFDLYARNGKRGGAWMDECQGRRRCGDGSLQLPIAFLTCNLNKPVGDDPALFTHDEVVTLFHEFGHGLHHMLTQVEAGSVAGISGVAWDAVELPSQFLENWCWEQEAITLISGHYQTGEPLPEATLKRMLEAKHFQSAMAMLRQLEFSLFDLKLHAEYDPEQGARVQETLDAVRADVAVLQPPRFNRFQNGFGHIFAGGYAAGYYSYKWAEVLSADAFSRFEEEGIFNEATGRSFRENILERGGSAEPMELFKAFRGREPDIAPLLRHSGIKG